MAEEIKIKTPVLIIGTKAQVDATTIGDNDLVGVTDEVFYTATETDAKIDKVTGDIADALEQINTSDDWKPNPLWADIKTIVENDTRDYPGKAGVIVYNFSDVSNFTLNTQRVAVATSDGAFYTYAEYGANTITHNWDTSKDVDDGNGYKTRWIMYYYSSQSIADRFENVAGSANVYGLGNNYIAYAVIRANLTNGYQLFYKQRMLERIDNTGFVIATTSLYAAFYECRKLTKVPNIDTSNTTTLNSTFRDCYLIKELPYMNTSKVTNFGAFCYGCDGLVKTQDSFDTSVATNLGSLFMYCSQLKKMPVLTDMSKNQVFTYAMYGMYSLVDAGVISLENLSQTLTTSTSPFTSMYSLEHIKLTLPSGSDLWLKSSEVVSIESFRYIADHAPDVTATPRTLTIGTVNIDRINLADPTIITDLQAKGWTVV